MSPSLPVQLATEAPSLGAVGFALIFGERGRIRST
jgi:hypothetical protein